MDPEKIQNDIDALLIFINDDMESIGGTISTTYFDFSDGQNDRTEIDKKLGWP